MAKLKTVRVILIVWLLVTSRIILGTPIHGIPILGAPVVIADKSATTGSFDFASVKASDDSHLVWSECKVHQAVDNTECASMTVPLDWDHPHANKNITIALARMPATDPSSRIGALLFNPGGPGASAISSMDTFSPRLNKYFDIVAMDPRGTGESVEVGPIKRQTHLFKRLPLTDAEYDEIAESNRNTAQAFVDVSGGVSKYVDTISVARDVEAVRIALSERQLNFVGFSYGAQVAYTYAELFPTKFRAIVLDGVSDRTVHDLEMTRRRYVALQDAFDRFAAWCDSSFTCRLYGLDSRQTLHHALDLAGDSADCLSNYMFEMLHQGWYTGLAEILATVVGKANWAAITMGWLVNRFTEPSERPHWTYDDLDMSSICRLTDAEPSSNHIAVRCLDSSPIRPNVSDLVALQQFLDTSTSAVHKFGNLAERATACIGWPFPPRNPPHRLQLPADTPPILIVNSLYDIQTPYVGALNVQSQIPNSVLLTTQREKHCSYDRWGTSKATRIIDDYLIAGELPDSGTVVNR
ncbi:hypothetical protein PRZ48_011921 [Zasmidium cellare]|uniref:AB hydrolase-1 domain-containing protein n=1 Tax=Zasmidium cellare TaxID=395010 RepID=A0ABR0E8A1_ZASCE|nr:hypothetical protein PRZ48_011921 [Zasmidium cellare]